MAPLPTQTWTVNTEAPDPRGASRRRHRKFSETHADGVPRRGHSLRRAQSCARSASSVARRAIAQAFEAGGSRGVLGSWRAGTNRNDRADPIKPPAPRATLALTLSPQWGTAVLGAGPGIAYGTEDALAATRNDSLSRLRTGSLGRAITLNLSARVEISTMNASNIELYSARATSSH